MQRRTVIVLHEKCHFSLSLLWNLDSTVDVQQSYKSCITTRRLDVSIPIYALDYTIY